jgi:ACT domain-containing protein
LKQGEKISNLENASRNLIHIPLTICKKTFKRISKETFAKTKQMVQKWSKMLKERKQSMHILWKFKLV